MTDFVTQPTPPTPEEVRLERQESLKLSLPHGVGVVGCGGVGSWIAYFLALAGVPKLWLFDSDKVSENNLNRLMLPPSAVGKPKSEAIAEAIGLIRPSCSCIPVANFDKMLADIINLKREILAIACSTDTLASRKVVYDWAREWDRIYVEASAEGDDGSIAFCPADFATEDETKPGYASVPVWVGPCVAAAQMACTFILRPSFNRDDVYRLSFVHETNHLTLFRQLNQETTLDDILNSASQARYRIQNAARIPTNAPDQTEEEP